MQSSQVGLIVGILVAIIITFLVLFLNAKITGSNVKQVVVDASPHFGSTWTETIPAGTQQIRMTFTGCTQEQLDSLFYIFVRSNFIPNKGSSFSSGLFVQNGNPIYVNLNYLFAFFDLGTTHTEFEADPIAGANQFNNTLELWINIDESFVSDIPVTFNVNND